MVELCELKLMQAGMGGDLNIDQHVAQLDFDDNSASMDRSSLFASVAVMDPATMGDSLDMEALRARYEHNDSNDYKLTFEDSGQWTTSEFNGGGGEGCETLNATKPPQPTNTRAVLNRTDRQKLYEYRDEGESPALSAGGGFGLRLLEELNNEGGICMRKNSSGGEESDETGRRKMIENLLSNAIVGPDHRHRESELDRRPKQLNNSALSGEQLMHGMTTWGRMRESEPLEERTTSLPALSAAASCPSSHCNHDGGGMSVGPCCCNCSPSTAAVGKWRELPRERAKRPLSEHLQRLANFGEGPPTFLPSTHKLGATAVHGQQAADHNRHTTPHQAAMKSQLSSQGLIANFVEQQQAKQRQQQQQQLFPKINSRQYPCYYTSSASHPQPSTAGSEACVCSNSSSGGSGLPTPANRPRRDVNDNEIGYEPASTAAIQGGSFAADRWQQHRHAAAAAGSSQQHKVPDLGRAGKFAPLLQPSSTLARPSTSSSAAAASLNAARRTFADLSPSQTEPDLKFLSLAHRIPAICRPSMSLDDMLRRAAKQGCQAVLADCLNNGRLLFQATSSEMLMHMNTLIEEGNTPGGEGGEGGSGPDSGLGSSTSPSSSSTVGGPLHIEDWSSLSALLPKHVVDACSFFKSNSSLLTGSPSSTNTVGGIHRHHFTGVLSSSNGATISSHPRTLSIDRCVRRCGRCLGMHSYMRLLEESEGEASNEDCRCYCAMTTSEIALPVTRNARAGYRPAAFPPYSPVASHGAIPLQPQQQERRLTTKLKALHSEELAIIGLPIYDQKRSLVEKVVEGVAELLRGASSVVLWSAMEHLLADGLKKCSATESVGEGVEQQVWEVVVAVTGPGPITNSIYQLVKSLEAVEKPANSRLCFFFKELLRLRSLDGWLSYVVLKENVLHNYYTDSAFLLKANTSYRSLFWRLVESLESLIVLQNRTCITEAAATTAVKRGCGNVPPYATGEDAPLKELGSGSASRLPPDSRVPKSSSVPERISSLQPPIISPRIGENLTKAGHLLSGAAQIREPTMMTSRQQQPIHSSMTPSDGSFKSCASEMRSSRIPVIVKSSTSMTPNSMGRRSRSTHPSSSSTPTSPNNERARASRSGSAFRQLKSREYTPLTVIAKVRETVGQRTSKGICRDATKTTGGRAQQWLPLSAGEKVRILSIRGPWSRCCRLHSRHGFIMNGVVPTHTLDLC